jgi:long-chain fatty acid transport protein
MKQRALSWFGALLALCFLMPVSRVQAGGLYLFDRGARPLSRGGAMVAGADDAGSALWYNPAGLAYAGKSVFSDAVLSVVLADFRRQYDDGTWAPEVKAKPTPLPIPTLAISHDFGIRKLNVGLGLLFPNAVLINYPRSIAGANGTRDPAPTRYSLIGLRGSIFGSIVGGASYKITKSLAIGGDFHITTGRFKAETALSACDGALCTFPEDREFDAYATIDAIPVWGFTGTAGIIYDMFGLVRWGASVTLPYQLRGPASIGMVMPQSQIFDNAKLEGDRANIHINFPTILRIGSELRPVPYLRMEGAFVWEQWSRQQTIDVTADNLRLTNVTGIGDYAVSSVSIDRKMRNSWSIRGGYELFFPPKWFMPQWKNLNFAFRGGLAYERGAFSKRSLSPLTLDVDKVLITGGFSFNVLFIKNLRMDTAAGYYIMMNQTVTESDIKQPAAIRPRYVDATSLGRGEYKVEAFYLGGSLVYKLD